jgi:hypothetical protein
MPQLANVSASISSWPRLAGYPAQVALPAPDSRSVNHANERRDTMSTRARTAVDANLEAHVVHLGSQTIDTIGKASHVWDNVAAGVSPGLHGPAIINYRRHQLTSSE